MLAALRPFHALLAALVLAIAWGRSAAVNAAPADDGTTVEPTRIGAFITSLADISETQRRFEIIVWVWLLSPASDGAIDPA
jgi:hypothetical protein